MEFEDGMKVLDIRLCYLMLKENEILIKGIVLFFLKEVFDY